MDFLYSDLLLQKLAEQSDDKLYKRLYNTIRMCILDGSLKSSNRLPASRELAKILGVSRNTVISVYEQLLAEGYLHARKGSGTFVAETLPDSYLASNSITVSHDQQKLPVKFSKRGLNLLKNISAGSQQWGAFVAGVPDVNEFPHQIFSKIQARINRRPSPQELTYSSQGGSSELRHALVDYLRVARSVHCEPEQILITEGIHQAVDLITRMLCNPKDHVWFEEPGYWGIRNILRMNEITICPQPVDEDGMVLPEHLDQDPRLIFVTPSHQFPLGSVMSLIRRQQLLATAAKTGSWIIEDDYDSEFRFSGQPIPALQGLTKNSPVIYIGTFSKTLYPALRLGYIVLPKSLMSEFKNAHADLYRGGHLLIQKALGIFIAEGHYAKHIRRMRLLYAKRRAFLYELIVQHLGQWAINEFTNNAGLHLILNLPDHCDDQKIAQLAIEQGVLVRPLSNYYMHSKNASKGLLMGFSSVPEEQMEVAFLKLVAIINAQIVLTKVLSS